MFGQKKGSKQAAANEEICGIAIQSDARRVPRVIVVIQPTDSSQHSNRMVHLNISLACFTDKKMANKYTKNVLNTTLIRFSQAEEGIKYGKYLKETEGENKAAVSASRANRLIPDLGRIIVIVIQDTGHHSLLATLINIDQQRATLPYPRTGPKPSVRQHELPALRRNHPK